MPLSDALLRSLKTPAKARKVFDERGLYLELSPSGGKWWRLKYTYAGKEKRLSLGVYPDVSLKDARTRRDEARKLLAEGKDPSESRKAAKIASKQAQDNSFEAVTREWFKRQAATKVPAYTERIENLFKRDIFPYIGKRPIAEIKAPELLAVIRRIEARVRDTAHRALGHCGQVFRYGVATGRCERDPSGDLRGALTPVTGRHFAATTDPKRLGQILAAMDTYEATIIVASALKLAPLVFVRPGELRRARWEHIDLEAKEWRFISSKTKQQHIVPLSTQAVAILLQLRRVTGHGKLAFPSARGKGRPMSDNAVLAAMRSLEIGKEEMTGHGFRAVARTILDEVLGYRPDIIEHQLAHRVRDPNGRAYNRTAHLAERHRMMQAWADYLDSLKL